LLWNSELAIPESRHFIRNDNEINKIVGFCSEAVKGSWLKLETKFGAERMIS
jgi:hypothetical protein